MTYETLLDRINETEAQMPYTNLSESRTPITNSVEGLFKFVERQLKIAQEKRFQDLVLKECFQALEEIIIEGLAKRGLFEEARDYASKYKALVEQYTPITN